jgi:hypothetical protein
VQWDRPCFAWSLDLCRHPGGFSTARAIAIVVLLSGALTAPPSARHLMERRT